MGLVFVPGIACNKINYGDKEDEKGYHHEVTWVPHISSRAPAAEITISRALSVKAIMGCSVLYHLIVYL
jgi:hypothetical protein